ncbi:acyl-ACP thioesterase domain-containing protein [Flavobacterium sp. SUN052]|uniref:acyl-[acyl-carrier-protein] thioesterase n=1 Tax=Flavobacterium sp. SUN052 TaxID=3002441 RepID=UPI00237ECBB9|nr:acyl-ACP thioesterase domain-containing protein [Flavobacterium sp. SUN052]MEC4003787.1 acyl-ACP thioesterase domain-containing protein [Flavobacterium sp. SUN052]
MPISPDFTSILTKDWEINFLQCYPNGYLKYTDLCNMLQLTAATHSEVGGISFSDMQEFNQAWVLSKMRVEIIKLPKWKDTITVKTWIKSLENSRSIRCLEMYLGDEKIVGCETFWAVFNTKTRRPEALALPHEHFEKYPNENATEKEFSRIDISRSKELVSKKTILLSDLDIVNHANSVKYLEWCLDYVAPKNITNKSLKSFEMNYLKEVSLNDSIEIEKSISQNPLIFTISKDEKVCFALELDF